jgi:membrane peptidoglycan carboxypeptidase
VVRDESRARAAELEGRYLHTLPDGRLRVLDASDPDFVALDELPRHVTGAFVAAEDARFFDHDGFDVEQLRRSFTIDVAAGRVERGGSTISQQLAKNLWLGRERTLGRKLVEAVLTWNLERHVAKRRILEAYLNVIELGDGVYGIGPAARRWFGKPARRLTPAEAAFLAAITPAPRTAEARLGRAGKLDAPFRERTEIVLAAMRRSHVVPSQEFRAHLSDVLALRLRPL